MAFVKKIWGNGDKITANDLNRIETAIESASSLVIGDFESKDNKIQSLNSGATTNQYPSARAVFNYIHNNLQDATYKQY